MFDKHTQRGVYYSPSTEFYVHMVKHLLFLTLFFTMSGIAQAQSDTSSIGITVSGGIDSTPPTTPTLLSATPVTYSQIDLVWSASTDDVLVSGYSILRDSVPVATTTLLSYSDTGLTASTTYSYSVRAFDPSFNYSTTSNSIATTTLVFSAPVATTSSSTSSSNSGTAARVALGESFNIETGLSTTSIMLETARPSRLELRWGRTDAYELGYITGGIFKSQHSFFIDGLEPGTLYEYEIVGYTPYGQMTVIKVGTFTTEQDYLNILPVNVGQFQALGVGSDVRLSWRLPDIPDIAGIRIVRSHIGFPQHPADGAVIYQGLGTGTVDENILSRYSPVYYTAFVYDIYGNISSGAVASVYLVSDTVGGEGQIESDTPSIIDTATTTIDEDRLRPDMKMPHASELIVTQGSESFSLIDIPIYLLPSEPFEVSLPVEAVSGNLKSIIVTLVNPTDTRQTYSYLLRINKDKTAYVAIVPAMAVAGRSQIKIDIYDYEAFVVASYQTPLEFVSVVEEDKANIGLMVYTSASFGLIFLFMFIWYFLAKRQAEDNV